MAKETKTNDTRKDTENLNLKSRVELLEAILELEKKINTAAKSDSDVKAKLVTQLIKLKDRYNEIKDIVISTSSYTNELNKLTEGRLKSTGALNFAYKDTTSELKKQFSSEYAIFNTKKAMIQTNNKILELEKEMSSTRNGGTKADKRKMEIMKSEAADLLKTYINQQMIADKQVAGTKSLGMLFGKNSESVKGIGKAFVGVSNSIKVAGDMMKTNPIGAMLHVALALKEAFDKIAEVLFKQNAEVVGIQKNLLVSGNEARRIRNEFVGIEASSTGIGSAFETVANMIQASTELSQAFGASIDFSGKNARSMVKDQIALTKELGLSGEEAGSLQKTMSIAGMNEKQFGEMTTKSTLEAKKRTGVTFNLKQAMQEISKLSAATTLSLMKNPKSLSDAVVKAKELGVSIDKMNSMADGLLDIESSIGAQFEASVLTGKNLNFELAREKALRNDIAGAAAEVLRQVGSAADFTNMNRVQQEAMAKAAGMSRDELAGSLIIQENLNKLNGIARKDMQDKLKHLSQEEQAKIMMGVHDEKSAYAAAKKVDAQTKMNAMQEKMYSMLGNVLTILEPIIDAFATIFESMGPIIGSFQVVVGWVEKWLNIIPGISASAAILKNTLTGILAIVTFIYTKKLASSVIDKISLGFDISKKGAAMGYNGILLARQALMHGELIKAIGIAVAYTIANPVKALIGLALATGVGAIIMSSMSSSSVEDGMISPDGGLVVSGQKGHYKLNKNDTIIAGTELGKKQKESESQQASEQGPLGNLLEMFGLSSDNSQKFTGITDGDRMISNSLTSKFDMLISQTNILINELKNKKFGVNLDGKQVQKQLVDVSQPKYARA